MTRLFWTAAVLMLALGFVRCKGKNTKTKSGWTRAELEAKVIEGAGLKSLSLRDWDDFFKGTGVGEDGREYSVRIEFDDKKREVTWSVSSSESDSSGPIKRTSTETRNRTFKYK